MNCETCPVPYRHYRADQPVDISAQNRPVSKARGVLDILKLREIYRHFSNAAERADTAADIISDPVMKVM